MCEKTSNATAYYAVFVLDVMDLDS